MIARRVGVLIRTQSRFSLQRFALLSSSSATHPRFSTVFSKDAETASAVYRHKLKFQRPTTISEWKPEFQNSVSFIGSVELPLNVCNTNCRFGTYTLLNARNAPNSNHGFRILLVMWDDMAKVCQNHLKPNDLIYVSGHLGSYTKADHDGKLRLYYKVTVKELNYVTKHGQGITCQKSKESNVRQDLGEAGMEKYENRLYLLQLYFHNPYEWWDNRKNKLYPNYPDFKHKDTGEAIWLSPNDPPWVKRQLQLLDSKMEAAGLRGHMGSRSRVSNWVYDG